MGTAVVDAVKPDSQVARTQAARQEVVEDRPDLTSVPVAVAGREFRQILTWIAPLVSWTS